MIGSLLILDQWAGPDVTTGTSKNWLYESLSRSMRVQVLNADRPGYKRRERVCCLLNALLRNPRDFRSEYHRQVEWAQKLPRSFKARTRRFQSALDRSSVQWDVVLQIGSLFGPVSRNGAVFASYHDQTMAMVERDWPEWLPPGFERFRDEFRHLEGETLRSKDVVLTYSERTRRSMIEDYGLDGTEVVTCPTACKIDFPEPEEVLGRRQEKLLFVNTDFYRKGGDLLLLSFREMRRKRPGLELVIAGGPFRDELPEGARFVGKLPYDQLSREYLEASLLVHSARYDAYPNALKEAQVCGLPAVVSGSGGMPEIVLHGRTGTVLESLDAESLTAAVLDLLDDSAKLRSMREACLVERERFRPEVCVARVRHALERAAQKCAGEVA